MTERGSQLEQAREAVAREEWPEAYVGLRAVDRSDMTARDLVALADAAWWMSEHDESIAARQRAFAAYVDEDDVTDAAYVAARLCIEHALRGESSVGAGWLMQSMRCLGDRFDCVEYGYVTMIRANVSRFTGDLAEAIELSREATQIGQRFKDRDLIAMGIHTEGLALVAAGRIDDGLALLDEAMAAVLTGRLDPYYTGAIYCNVIEACLGIADVRRAGEWTEASLTWCASLPPASPYPALCRANRAELARLVGEWDEALAAAEALVGSSRPERTDPEVAASAHELIGEIRRRTGDLAGAEEAFGHAQAGGRDAQPGLALLRLAQGKVGAAQAAIRLASSGDTDLSLRRAPLLTARVEVEVAAGDLASARAALGDLETIAQDFPTATMNVACDVARGRIALAEGDGSAALQHLRRAAVALRDLRLPYDTAQVRSLLGSALRATGDEEAARVEWEAARSYFEHLGATPDLEVIDGFLGTGPGLPAGLTAREAEVLRLVAAGNSNREIASILVISEHTVARHLQNMFAKLGVSSRSGATAFAFEHGLA